MQPRRRVTDFLDADEIRELTEPSDLRGGLALATTWAMIAGCFALVAIWPRWWTVGIAVTLLGGRQLALAVLMHDAAHRCLFRSKRLNTVLGKWLCAAPIWTCLTRYRAHHLGHHAHTNGPKDPDLGLVTPFPVPPRALLRKFVRDLLGLTGVRRVVGLLAMDLGLISYTASTGFERLDQSGRTWGEIARGGARNLAPVVLSNFALWSILSASGHGLLYLLWIAAYLTSFSAVIRLRSIAEHACTEASTDPFFNTRTTRAGWLARLTLAPHNVNYHLEHHLLPTVPQHALPRMHRLLHERGALEGCHVAASYWKVLRAAVRTPSQATEQP